MAAMRPHSRASASVSARPRSASFMSADDELKTAVKVAVRVRPPLDANDPSLDLIPARFRGITCKVMNPTTLTIDSTQGKKLFVFDRVFGDQETQEGIWDYISDSVNSFCQGYNVSILAYGQSGAGKSYTMGTASPGEQAEKNVQGIIPRAAAALFAKLHSDNGTQANETTKSIRPPSRYSTSGLPTQTKIADGDKNWQLKATYVEIYNEQLRDLLVPDSVPANERSTVAIREDAKGRIILTGLQQVTINSIEDLLNALNFGSSIRQTDATAINSKSSRSHAVFSLNLVQKKNKASKSGTAYTGNANAMNGNEHWVTMDSKLHFVDLAGSERLKNSGLTGERVKEGISINAGLASLGKVISQLSTKNAGGHVSYRDSRLTRLLQDSLGGNAITYMVACINPVEFHLSESLNTVQYAQRARNIQSRPQVQQRAEDGDKQLIIDRLRSEVAFLREQIRLSERTERRNNSHQERNNRYASRETELQNQLLDAQENYSALSQRHARLVSELAKSKDIDEDMPALKTALANIASERLDRSNNFSEAVEQVVLEYEKTIQSLESSLSNTRSLLSTSESSLLEREAKIVYLEAVAQQLQARIQKAMDREADSENYLRDLEAKLEGISSGEEKYHVVIADLRKELQRIRESESSAEEYISTLEERLAEAEQDSDIMQREIKRLEHVVERQRGIGKMDGLHQELDMLRQDETAPKNGQSVTGVTHVGSDTDMFHDRLIGTTSANHPNGEVHSESAEAEWKSFGPMEGDEESNISRSEYGDANETQILSPQASTNQLAHANQKRDPHAQSPAQSRAIADKLETVTMELFDLRVDHESTVNELDDVSRKYEIALSTLAELQDAVDEARSPRPMSFLERNNIHGQNGDHYRMSSRMLSSDLSSLGRAPTLVDASTTSGADSTDSAISIPTKDTESLADSVRRLKRANAEKDINMAELTENYSQLQAQHENALNYIEELKEEAQKAAQVTKRASIMPMSSRRALSTIANHKDDTRHLVALRTIAAENFDGHPDAMKSFEQNLTAAMAATQDRADRVAQLESELLSTKKEMDAKNAMISGLTRERSSRPTAAAMDITLIGQLREHLNASQKQIQDLHEASTSGTRELQSSLSNIKSTLNNGHKASPSLTSEKDVPGGFPAESIAESEAKDTIEPQALHKELSEWEEEHNKRMDALHESEQQLLMTISGLEVSLRNAENLHAERGAAATLRASMSTNSHDLEAEKAKHVETVAALQREIDGYKATAEGHATKLSQLESSYALIIKDVEEDQKSRELTEVELRTHRDLVNNLEHQIEQQKSLAMFHQQGLTSLQESHAKELEELKGTMEAEHQQKLEQELSKHTESTSLLQAELEKAQVELATLMRSVSSVVESEPDSQGLHARIKSITKDHQDTGSKQLSAVDALVVAQREAETHKKATADLTGKITELTLINEETLKELTRSGEKEKKSSRLVQELETQLTEIFDQHKSTTTKLSSAQSEKAEAEKQLAEVQNKVAQLETQLSEAKRSTVYAGSLHSQRDSLGPQSANDLHRHPSDASTLRKSGSHQSLPSPPPAVPLPPLPSLTGQPPPSPNMAKGSSDFQSPPGSRHASRDMHGSQQFQQQLDEQDGKIKQMEKHLAAEKQLTSTLEEALVDLETQANRTRQEMEAWKKKCREVEEEASGLRRERGTIRNSIQAVEEERDRRIRAEQARRQLEERMEALGKKTKKKAGGLNCF